MRLSLTFIITSLLFFITSCTVTSSKEVSKIKIQLSIQTNQENKEKIIELLLKDQTKFLVNFDKQNSYNMEDDVLDSNLKYFCKSLLEDEREVIENAIFKDKKSEDKKVLIVYSKKYKDVANELKNKYPNQSYFAINISNYEKQIKDILNVDMSLNRNNRLSKLDYSIQILHTPRIRNDIMGIYFLTDYNTGKTIVPIFKSYTLDTKFYSSTEIFHDASNFKKLVDFENTFVPITNKMLEEIYDKNGISIKSEIETILIKDFLMIEKIHQNNLFRDEIIPLTGNLKIKRNGCLDRNLGLWKVSTVNIKNQI